MNLTEHIRNIPDFPKPGIQFKDITTLLNHGPALKYTIDHWRDRYANQNINHVVGAEARGFIFGTALAYALGCGFVPVRKPGKLPHDTFAMGYELEYGSDSLEVHSDAFKKGERVILIDDLLATGGTMEATVKLVSRLEVEIVEITFLIELCALNGRERLRPYPVFSLVEYKD